MIQMSLKFSIGDSHGVVSGLSPELAEQLRDLLRPFAVASAPPPADAVDIQVTEAPDEQHGTRWVVWLRGKEMCSHVRADDLLQYVEWLAVSRSLIATSSAAVFHAAALTHESAGVMLVGPSGAGKSTLTLNLIKRGWQPLTDDATLMDVATGTIRPFPRCFHVDPAWAVRSADAAAFEWLASLPGHARPRQWAAEGQHITAVFFVERDPVGPSRCVPLFQARGAGLLVSHAIKTMLTPTEVTRAAVRLVSGASCYRLTNGDLEATLDFIASLPNSCP
jgi:hypothetical protein